MARIKVTHIITSLLMGGAEKVLLRLIQNMDDERFENEVIALTTVGPLADQFEKSGIKVTVLGFSKGGVNLSCFIALMKAIRRSRADVIQTWLYHGDFLGGLAARLCTRTPVLWNLRQSNLDEGKSTKTTVVIAKICAALSAWIPQRIVCGSLAARQIHAQMGYNQDKMVLIENGFDTEKHHHSQKSADAFRAELGVSGEPLLIGHAGRFDPQKDHQTMVKAAEIVLDKRSDVKFIFCGTEVNSENDGLQEMIAHSAIQEHVILKDIVYDMRAFYSAMDIQVLSSAFGEGGSNVLGEAMACETPCISTDVGDSAHIIGDTGDIVPPGNPQALAERILSRVEESPEIRRQRGVQARKAINEGFSLKKMVEAYQSLYQNAVKE